VTHIYLATGSAGAPALNDWDWDAEPINLLCALPFLRTLKPHWRPRRLMLDSGAFTIWNSGGQVELETLVRESKKPRWTESVSLDVIGDWRGTQANAIKMRALGSPAMPVFHMGDPWELLTFYCSNWPKVGLGGMVGLNVRHVADWLDGVFARAWPHRYHSFGMTNPRLLLRYPFHSADSSTWCSLGRFGTVIGWEDGINQVRQFDAQGASAGAYIGMIPHYIRKYYRLETHLRSHWRRELSQFTP
jgi:hypothetical protein